MRKRLIKKLKYHNGWYAHEIQIGPAVIMLIHKTKRLKIWHDPMWRL